MFQTVRDLIYKKALGKEGGATHGEVVSLSQRTALSNYLPYAFYDRGEQAYHNTDDTTGYLWELLPLYFTSPKNVNAYTSMQQADARTRSQWSLSTASAHHFPNHRERSPCRIHTHTSDRVMPTEHQGHCLSHGHAKKLGLAAFAR